jgi:uncharacterized protein (UPF0147 family)
MGKDDEHELVFEIELPGAATADLRGRQSVRATFRLSEGCIDAISIVSKHLGIKQKSLFDHLAEDISSLKTIARGAQDTKMKRENRVQKTFVISRRSLYSLEEISKSYNAPRDFLVEYSVKRLLPIIIRERKKHEARKKKLHDIKKHILQGLRLLEQLEVGLGADDPLYDKFENIMGAYKNAFQSMDDFIEKGKIIEDFDPDLLAQMI